MGTLSVISTYIQRALNAPSIELDTINVPLTYLHRTLNTISVPLCTVQRASEVSTPFYLLPTTHHLRRASPTTYNPLAILPSSHNARWLMRAWWFMAHGSWLKAHSSMLMANQPGPAILRPFSLGRDPRPSSHEP